MYLGQNKRINNFYGLFKVIDAILGSEYSNTNLDVIFSPLFMNGAKISIYFESSYILHFFPLKFYVV